MKNERHNCGGILKEKRVAVTRNIGGFNYTFIVEGKQCNKCLEEIISRDTLHALEVSPSEVIFSHSKSKGIYTVDIDNLDIPVIGLPSAGTVIDNTIYSSSVSTGEVIYATP